MNIFSRKRFFVSSFQYKFLAASIAYFLVTLLVFTTVVFAPMVIELQAKTVFSPQKQELANALLYLHTRFWPAIVVLFFLLSFHSILLTHRVAGPLYRFRKICEAAAQGDLSTEVRIRKNDYLHEDAQTINAMFKRIRGGLREAAKRNEDTTALLSQLREVIPHGTVEEIEDCLQRLKRDMEAIGCSLQQFKIDAAGREQPGAARLSNITSLSHSQSA